MGLPSREDLPLRARGEVMWGVRANFTIPKRNRQTTFRLPKIVLVDRLRYCLFGLNFLQLS